MRRLVLVAPGFPAVLSGCIICVWEVPDFDDDWDVACPWILHEPVADAQPQGTAVGIVADVWDESGIAEVRVVYQDQTAGDDWNVASLSWAGAASMGEDAFGEPVSGTRYEGELDAQTVRTGAMRYFLEAVDEWEQTCCFPDACGAAPIRFRVTAP